MKTLMLSVCMLLGTAALTSASHPVTKISNQAPTIDKMQADPEYGAIPVHTSCGKLGFIIYEKGTKTTLKKLGEAVKKLEARLCGPGPSPFM